MKFKKCIIAAIASVLTLSVASCTQKSPDKNYLSEERISEIISTFDGSLVPTSFNSNANLNYFNRPEVSKNIVLEDLPFTAYPLKAEVEANTPEGQKAENTYLRSCASFYLRLPLQLTKDNWDQGSDKWSTRYQLESRLYRSIGSLDQVYYYETSDGGLACKAFGVNKELIINNTELWDAGIGGEDIIDITCSGKWNITIVYNNCGLLVSEEFETVNRQDPKSKNCYGKTTYEYF